MAITAVTCGEANGGVGIAHKQVINHSNL